MAQVPRTRYARCGDIDIAYQVVGDGPVDLVVLPGPSIPIDSIDTEPSMYRFYRRLASFSRVIRFDQRGMGLSSRVPSLDALGPNFWAEDAIAVHGCGRMRAGHDVRAELHRDDRTRSGRRSSRAGAGAW